MNGSAEVVSVVRHAELQDKGNRACQGRKQEQDTLELGGQNDFLRERNLCANECGFEKCVMSQTKCWPSICYCRTWDIFIEFSELTSINFFFETVFHPPSFHFIQCLQNNLQPLSGGTNPFSGLSSRTANQSSVTGWTLQPSLENCWTGTEAIYNPQTSQPLC